MARTRKITRVKSLDELKQICDGRMRDFFIQLNFCIRSTKAISYDRSTDKFYIVNLIDGSEQELSSKEIMDENNSNIGKAIELGAFYQY